MGDDQPQPQQISSYQILRKLGEGGMGAVYEGIQPQIHRRAAIKVLHPELSRDKEQLHRFFNEARASNLVRHPSLVDIFECGTAEDGTAFIIMEFLDGETLRARTKREGPLGSAALPVIRQIATALAALHFKNIVHRDLKPDNVMLVKDPEVPGGERVKILDFGIAKLIGDSSQEGQQFRTRTGTMMGTPVYMSPEQCRGNAEVKQPSDVYSLGAMLFEIYAGQPPFVSDGLGELVGMHMFQNPPRLSALVPSVPAGLDALVAEMLEKQPHARPSMAAVAERVQQLAFLNSASFPRGKSFAAPPIGATTQQHATSQKQGMAGRRGWRILGVTVLGVLGGIGVRVAQRHQPSVPPVRVAMSTTATPAMPAVQPQATRLPAQAVPDAQVDPVVAQADLPARPQKSSSEKSRASKQKPAEHDGLTRCQELLEKKRYIEAQQACRTVLNHQPGYAEATRILRELGSQQSLRPVHAPVPPAKPAETVESEDDIVVRRLK